MVELLDSVNLLVKIQDAVREGIEDWFVDCVSLVFGWIFQGLDGDQLPRLVVLGRPDLTVRPSPSCVGLPLLSVTEVNTGSQSSGVFGMAESSSPAV